jgi:hypothetical protein
MEHSHHFMLEFRLKEDKKKWYVYGQGISPLNYRLEGIKHFRIYKQFVVNLHIEKQDITWRFLQFQLFYRRRLQLRKLLWKNLRKLETGEVTFHQLASRLK